MSRWGTESIGGSVSICRHTAAQLVCDANLHYPLGPLGLVARWVVMLVATLALLGAYLLHGLLGAAQQNLVISLGLRGLQRIRHQVFEQDILIILLQPQRFNDGF